MCPIPPQVGWKTRKGRSPSNNEYGVPGNAKKVHDWTFAHFPDRDFGEWFGYLRRDGQPSSLLKGNMWKGPFHIPRALLLCWKLLEEMLIAT